MPSCANKERTQEQEIRQIKKRTTIPGTWEFDFDSSKLVGLGAKREECDVWFEHRDTTRRRLVPENGARIAYLGKIDPSTVTPDFLRRLRYSERPIEGTDCSEDNPLAPGAVIAVKTNQGKYVAFKIDGYSPLVRDGRTKIPNYDLHVIILD